MEIEAQEENPYKTMEHNQLALQLYQMGFFRPEMADQALRCLTLMDFKNKDAVVAAIEESAAAGVSAAVDAPAVTPAKMDAVEQVRRQVQLGVMPQ